MNPTGTTVTTAEKSFSEEREALRVFIGNLSTSDFFQPLADYLSDLLKVEYVLFGKLTGHDPESIVSVGLSANGKAAGTMEYGLSGTPCENVVGRNMCYFPCNVQQMFPHDQDLKDFKIESYLGLPLNAPTGKPLGLLVLMSQKTIPNATQVEELLHDIVPICEQELQSLVKQQETSATGNK